jgi:tyrosinase
MFVKRFEDEMRTLYPTLTIPYWDWSLDAKRPLKSPIFTPNFLGFVKLGAEGDCRWRVSYPKKHCLVRNYSPKHFSSFYDTKTMVKLISRKGTFEEFSDLIEGAPHGAAHIMIGGKNGDFSGMMSPNDPFFWLHHAYIDKLWVDWQNSSAKRFTEYNGKHRGKSVSASDYLKPFGVQVRDVFDVEKDLCYRYQPYSGRGGEGNLNAEKKEGNLEKQEGGLNVDKNEGNLDGDKKEGNFKKKEENTNELNKGNLNTQKKDANTENKDSNAPKADSNAPKKESTSQKNLKTDQLSNEHLPNQNDAISNAKRLNPITHFQPTLGISSTSDQQIQTDDEISTIPREIPQHWIKHHGFDVQAFRRNEQILQKLFREANGMELNGCIQVKSIFRNFFLCICLFYILIAF